MSGKEYYRDMEKSEIKESSISLFKKCSLCSVESVNLTDCKYCKERFCKDHIEAKTINDSLKSKKGHLCSALNKKQKNIKAEKQLPEKQSNVDKKQSFWKRLK
jgi:predicted nucleic acid binding AN1-type Zn finger protein